ncbi:exodeoxyribonuclease VII large subunit [Sabulicella rubraurantiaca]|uniref:exodeoxyribonuclease VII large subunit n=1 Tax=Sabulicella rubraurantiaca TaxID=2811429 RepID=UPI001A97291B|nr:exodeoxyribonuclease VII large subunit [Sabulicella rubraurantiaca]
MTSGASGNIPEYGVGELGGAIKRTLESAFGRIRVRGEMTEVKPYSSGHVYLSLKDGQAKVEAVVWKGTVPRVGLKPENGVEVIATGRISTYADRSKYQLIIERLEYAGEGALLKRIEMLRQRLQEEGLFERRRPLPLLPEVIGVVTSESGAVIQDIRTTLARRFPRRVILWPVQVQGAGAAEQVAAAIRGFSLLAAGGAVPRPDVLIVARGGGSLEDLMAFNEEAVVRAAAECTIPLISAVGHETDTTLIDFAADRRAPTPTAAAEMAVPSRDEMAAGLAQLGARLKGRADSHLGDARLRLRVAGRGLPDLPALVANARQRLDERAERLDGALPRFLDGRRLVLSRLAGSLRHPREVIAAKRGTLGETAGRLFAAWGQAHQRRCSAPALQRLSPAPIVARLRAGSDRVRDLGTRLEALGSDGRPGREARVRLEALSARLEAVSYNSVLRRGFALVQRAGGAAVTEAAALKRGEKLTLVFADGSATVREESDRQGRLF